MRQLVFLAGHFQPSLGGALFAFFRHDAHRMRDVVCNEVPLVLKQGELYISCAMAGAITAVVSIAFGLPNRWALVACAVVCWVLRAGSITFGWHLPVYRSRPPRS